MKSSKLAVLLVAVALAGGCADIGRSRNLADPAVPGKVLALQICSACHGIDGNSVSPEFPKLAGQQSAYLVKQLKEFRSHQRSDPPGPQFMWGITRHLTDDQIAQISEYFSGQRALRNAGGNPALVAEGRRIYQHGIPQEKVLACSGCHGADGQGNGSYPRLAFQHAHYVERQLEVFQSTQGRPGTPMESITHPLTGSDKKSIAAYVQAFPEAK